jgi:hypothetical protein
MHSSVFASANKRGRRAGCRGLARFFRHPSPSARNRLARDFPWKSSGAHRTKKIDILGAAPSLIGHEGAAYDVMSRVSCLHEKLLPAECGCCPSLADSLTVEQETEPLRFGANRLQVQCDPGQFLVLGNCMGNCMIDAPPSAADIADVKMFRRPPCQWQGGRLELPWWQRNRSGQLCRRAWPPLGRSVEQPEQGHRGRESCGRGMVTGHQAGRAVARPWALGSALPGGARPAHGSERRACDCGWARRGPGFQAALRDSGSRAPFVFGGRRIGSVGLRAEPTGGHAASEFLSSVNGSSRG